MVDDGRILALGAVAALSVGAFARARGARGVVRRGPVSAVDRAPKEKFVTTPDDWYPTFEDQKVRVRLYTPQAEGKKWLVCVWGADDFGMERYVDTRQEAVGLFDGIGDGVTIKALQTRKFQRV